MQKEEALKRKRRDEVATFLKQKVSTKSAVVKGEKVSYFSGKQARIRTNNIWQDLNVEHIFQVFRLKKKYLALCSTTPFTIVLAQLNANL